MAGVEGDGGSGGSTSKYLCQKLNSLVASFLFLFVYGTFGSTSVAQVNRCLEHVHTQSKSILAYAVQHLHSE